MTLYEAKIVHLEAGKFPIQRGREEGERRQSIAIATRMKQDGADVEIIMVYTGLSKEEIGAL